MRFWTIRASEVSKLEAQAANASQYGNCRDSVAPTLNGRKNFAVNVSDANMACDVQCAVGSHVHDVVCEESSW